MQDTQEPRIHLGDIWATESGRVFEILERHEGMFPFLAIERQPQYPYNKLPGACMAWYTIWGAWTNNPHQPTTIDLRIFIANLS